MLRVTNLFCYVIHLVELGKIFTSFSDTGMCPLFPLVKLSQLLTMPSKNSHCRFPRLLVSLGLFFLNIICIECSCVG